MNVLFICNQNKHRSRTAGEIFSRRWNTKSAGLYNNRVTKQQISWADVIFVMEDDQRSEIGRRFPREYLQKRIISLEISDIYQYNDPKLVRI